MVLQQLYFFSSKMSIVSPFLWNESKSSNQLHLPTALSKAGTVIPVALPVHVGTANMPAPKLVEWGSVVYEQFPEVLEEGSFNPYEPSSYG